MNQLVKDIMKGKPACCTPDTPLREVARMMVEEDCGAIPVADDDRTCRPVIGMITDRDIVCRSVAQGKNPLELMTRDCMSNSIASVRPDDTVDHALEVMEKLQIRRLPVLDDEQGLIGIVTQAHIAKNAPEQKVGEMLKHISQETGSPSRISPAVRS